jgi:thiamine transport system ATP-binding protein
VIECHAVTVVLDGKTILDGANLTLARGEVVSLTGPSGAGKTTLLRAIAGLDPLTGGRVYVGGRDVTGEPTHRRGIGLVFQDNQLFPHLDVAGNVGYAMRTAGAASDEIVRRVADLLALVGLEGFGPRSVERLSGGEAKRVAVARSLAADPEVLLLDEPLTGLDAALHDRMLADLAAVLGARNTTVLHVTPDLHEAAVLSSRSVDVRDVQRGGARVLSTEDVLPLRLRVLRDGTPSRDPRYPEDDLDGTVHLGTVRDGRVVATSTWLPRPCPVAPDERAVQLRGMAVDPALQGSGVGRALLRAGTARAHDGGATLVWARARDTALGFYSSEGFETVGDAFMDDSTGLSHHLVLLRLAP